jgi:hypothetical protein
LIAGRPTRSISVPSVGAAGVLPEDDELVLADVVEDPEEDDDCVVVDDPDEDELLDDELLEEDELLDEDELLEDELLDDELLEELLDEPPSELLVVPHAAAKAAEARINRYFRFMVSFPSP